MDAENLCVGVMAIQGSFEEHILHLHHEAVALGILGVKILTVRTCSDLKIVDALILPGGESTTMTIEMQKSGLLKAIRERANKDPTFVIWGTCAGLILLANRVNNNKIIEHGQIGGFDIEVSRNGYGRQINSFEASLMLDPCFKLSDSTINAIEENTYPGVFIRAPIIDSVDAEKVQILARYNCVPVAVLQGSQLLGTTFHPELTQCGHFHRYFLHMCQNAQRMK